MAMTGRYAANRFPCAKRFSSKPALFATVLSTAMGKKSVPTPSALTSIVALVVPDDRTKGPRLLTPGTYPTLPDEVQVIWSKGLSG